MKFARMESGSEMNAMHWNRVSFTLPSAVPVRVRVRIEPSMHW
jgi:hypothetical protein